MITKRLQHRLFLLTDKIPNIKCFFKNPLPVTTINKQKRMTDNVILLLLYGISAGLFMGLLQYAKAKRANRLFDDRGEVVTSPVLLLLHVAGILLFGLMPLLVKHTAGIHFFASNSTAGGATALSALLLVAVIFVAPRLALKEAQLHKRIAPVRQQPPFAYLAAYFLLRIAFIVAYECWFRGFLLMDSVAQFGVPVAVCINVALYTLLHTVNGKKEMLGCIPFGLLLCSLCIWMGVVWPAILLHLALTLCYETTLLHQQKILQHENSGHRRKRLHRA